jgi:hypothetical protein
MINLSDLLNSLVKAQQVWRISFHINSDSAEVGHADIFL